jgi:hypothetical protein
VRKPLHLIAGEPHRPSIHQCTPDAEKDAANAVLHTIVMFSWKWMGKEVNLLAHKMPCLKTEVFEEDMNVAYRKNT